LASKRDWPQTASSSPPSSRHRGFRPQRAAEAARAIFSGPDRPDAVFCGNDPLAFAVMDTLRYELGLRVPEDVAVAGYDDVPIASWLAYNLTTVRQHAHRLVKHSVDILIARIEGGTPSPRSVVLESPLVVRGTTRPVPAGGESRADAPTRRACRR
jgi:DNA-binding LacI/PurR family transcriptional regulator